ncbi:MAG TPA: response regulator [Xanthobacteraceae bacterium]|jgi:FixJ family two-component response regulator
MNAAAPTIHVVDDDDLFRTALARALRRSGYHVQLYESADRLMEAQPTAGPGCIVLDVMMPGVSGPELQSYLAKRDNVLPIIFLTGYGDLPTGVRAIKAGAEDFLTKPVAKKILIEAIQRALARYEQTRERLERLASMRSIVDTFTPRQREVFDLVVRGKMNKQIAHELRTAERTIKAHRHAVMGKLKIRSVAEAVSIAEQLGILAHKGNND